MEYVDSILTLMINIDFVELLSNSTSFDIIHFCIVCCCMANFILVYLFLSIICVIF